MADREFKRMQFDNGNYYEGEWLNGKYDGNGFYRGKGFSYSGEFKEGCYDGHGVLRHDPVPGLPEWDNGPYDMGESYSGEWRKNRKVDRIDHRLYGITYTETYEVIDDKSFKVDRLYYLFPEGDPITDKDTIKCWHCGQSGFIIETINETLIFDWYIDALPVLNKDKPVYVFITHPHGDHFNHIVLSVAARYELREIYFGLDVGMANPYKFEPRLEDILCCFRGEQRLETDFGEVMSLRSTDMGVAYIVKASGHTFFHAGDLFIMADSSYTSFKREMAPYMPYGKDGDPKVEAQYREKYESSVSTNLDQFRRYTDALKDTGPIDYAMLPMDPRWYEYGLRTVDHYLDIADIRLFTPMHLWEQWNFVDEYVKHNPKAADRMIALKTNSLPIRQTIELKIPYIVKLR